MGEGRGTSYLSNWEADTRFTVPKSELEKKETRCDRAI